MKKLLSIIGVLSVTLLTACNSFNNHSSSDTQKYDFWLTTAEVSDEIDSNNSEVSDYELPADFYDFSETASSNAEDDRLTFAFKTDSHYTYGNATDSFKLYAELQNHVPLSFYSHGGDLINGDHSTEDIAIKSLTSAIDAMTSGSSVPFISIRGNHDDNSWPYISDNSKYGVFPEDGVLDTEQWKKYAFVRPSSSFITGEDGCYAYFDHEQSKIRVLFVDTSDLPYIADENGFYKYGAYAGHGIRNSQLNFMAKALAFEDKGEDAANWAVLIVSHVPIETLRSADSEYRFGIPDSLPRNSLAFLRLLKAYQQGEIFNETQNTPTNYGDGGKISGSFNDFPGDFSYSVYADFSENGPGEVIGFVSGHTHTDNLSTNVGKVSYTNDKIYPALSDGYVYMSIGSNGFAVITISRNYDGTDTIYVDRYGTRTLPRSDMISEGDDAIASTDASITGVTSTDPDTGTVASGHFSVNYSQN